MTQIQPYHEGELSLQEESGRRSFAQALGPRIWNKIPDDVVSFVSTLPFVVTGCLDDAGQPWASILAARPGFVSGGISPAMLRIQADIGHDDPLFESMNRGGDFALLAIDFSRRLRYRINGRGLLENASILMNVMQCYKNCPQYIHARSADFEPGVLRDGTSKAVVLKSIDERVENIIARADTFFIATHGSGNDADDTRLGADVSLRSGNPGFVEVDRPSNKISVPDYLGNFMFNTLGNIRRHPKCGLLFVDFSNNLTLQLTGAAHIDGSETRAKQVKGAQRFLDVVVEKVFITSNALPLSWRLIEYAPDLRRYSPSNDIKLSKEKNREDITVVVENVVNETDNFKSFYLKALEGELPPFQPGQFIVVNLEVEGRKTPKRNCYSLSEFHKRPGRYRIGVNLAEGATTASGSRHLHEKIKAGTNFKIGCPAGQFTLDVEESRRPIALVSLGSGVTPVLSMLHALADAGSVLPIWFIHGARNGAKHAYRAEVQHLAKYLPNLKIFNIYSRPGSADLIHRDYQQEGRVNTDLLKKIIPIEAHVYMCGPEKFIREAAEGLRAWGMGEEQIRFELFAEERTATSALGKDRAKVAFSGHAEIEWRNEFGSLLELAESSGIDLPYSCRLGSCGSCEARLLSGKVIYPTQPTYEPGPGNILLCCSQPTSDVAIEVVI